MARLIVVLAAAFTLLSCGGGDDKKAADAAKAPTARADPAATKLAEQAAGPNAHARSGVIDGSVEITLRGARGFSEPFSATVSGPFSYRKGSALPDYELDIGVRNYGVELSSVRGRSYVTIGTTGYALPGDVRDRLVRSSSRGANGLTRTLEQFGIAPLRWEKDRRLAGIEQLDGVAVRKITTGFTAGRILRDANTLLGLLASLKITRAVGLPSQIPARARRVIVRGVQTKRGASWIGVKDKAVRRSGFTMTFAIPKADRREVDGISAGKVVGLLNVTEVGRPQQIHAPESLGSFGDFQLAIDALGDAQDGG
ncbi:MAG: hypothetical protein QOI73_639 [Solirubrobacteraceae bacterium]|nr:hypothetical protein [Solirubrobacteraceae bacterium]